MVSSSARGPLEEAPAVVVRGVDRDLDLGRGDLLVADESARCPPSLEATSAGSRSRAAPAPVALSTAPPSCARLSTRSPTPRPHTSRARAPDGLASTTRRVRLRVRAAAVERFADNRVTARSSSAKGHERHRRRGMSPRVFGREPTMTSRARASSEDLGGALIAPLTRRALSGALPKSTGAGSAFEPRVLVQLDVPRYRAGGEQRPTAQVVALGDDEGTSGERRRARSAPRSRAGAGRRPSRRRSAAREHGVAGGVRRRARPCDAPAEPHELRLREVAAVLGTSAARRQLGPPSLPAGLAAAAAGDAEIARRPPRH